MDATPDGRLILTQRINQIEFEEYPAVAAAWLKAVGIHELRRYISDDAGRALIERHERGESGDLDLQRGMIQLFLREWLCFNVPENIGVWGLEVSEFRPVSRHEALQAANRIVTACQASSGEGEQPQHSGERAFLAAMRGRGRVGPAADPPPTQLRAWFGDVLFAQPGSSFFLHDSPGGATVRFNLANPRVIGLAPDIIEMLWLE